MKGETSKDGSIHGNAQLVRSHDMHKGLKGASKSGPMGEESGGSDHSEIQDVVAEHGPATSHTITSNDDGSFDSHTQHESGHEHHAKHESLAHAHEHGMHAMGGEPDGDEMAPSKSGNVGKNASVFPSKGNGTGGY